MGLFSSPEKKAEKAYQAAGALLMKSSSAENRKKAGELYLTAAQLGHADAQFRYGALILRAAEAQDPAPGLAWVEKAARQGHAGALELCVEMYAGARGHLTPDLARAAEWAQTARRLGSEKAEALCRLVESHQDPAALYQLALKEFEGEDHRPAIADLERAAQQGYLPAQLEAARIYEVGTTGKARFSDWGVPPNEEKAMYWYEKAAEGGNLETEPEVQYRVARRLYTKKKDLLGALSLLEKAMLQGHGEALALYRKLHIPGTADELLKECGERARKGDAWAGFLCAELLSWGEDAAACGVDPGTLFACCRQAAREGRAEAQARCGWMCETGMGTEADENAALDWYAKSAGQGDSVGLFYCGRMLCQGAGAKRDPAKGLALLEQAYEKDNDSPAAAWCGRMYLLGQGVAQDSRKALDWYEKVLRQVDKDARLSLGGDPDKALFRLGQEFYLRGRGEEARTLLRDAATRSHFINASLSLAVLARQGTPGETEPNERQAAAWFSEWLRNVEPGHTVRFGRYRQRRSPREYPYGVAEDPIVWSVLEVQRDKALLLCMAGLRMIGEPMEGSLFSEAEKTFVRQGPFRLNREQYQNYIAEKKLAPPMAVPTLYAAATTAQLHRLQYEFLPGGKLNISGEEYNVRENQEEWAERRWWINYLTSDGWRWALEDGVVLAAGAVREAKRLEGVAYRPAVWLGLG